MVTRRLSRRGVRVLVEIGEASGEPVVLVEFCEASDEPVVLVEFCEASDEPVVVVEFCEASDEPVVVVEFWAVLSSQRPFGVLVGSCPEVYSYENSIIEMLMSSIHGYSFNDFYVFYFTTNRSCMVVLSAQGTVSYTVHFTNGGSSRSDTSSRCIDITSPVRIVSESNLQVVVSNMNQDGTPVSLCTIVPTSLFMADYVWKLPENITSNMAVVISPNFLTDIHFNKDPIAGNIITEKIQLNEWNIVYLDLPFLKRPVYRLFSLQWYSFGCYVYGAYKFKEVAWASPVNFADIAPLPVHNIDEPIRSSSTTVTPKSCLISHVIKGDKVDNDCDGQVDEEVTNSKGELQKHRPTYLPAY
ncbi:hypothetical protein Btru_070336 [Bulinus truncatus]|nr:hypothetical protein Btru_070336 [Bulinus truncatus]